MLYSQNLSQELAGIFYILQIPGWVPSLCSPFKDHTSSGRLKESGLLAKHLRENIKQDKGALERAFDIPADQAEKMKQREQIIACCKKFKQEFANLKNSAVVFWCQQNFDFWWPIAVLALYCDCTIVHRTLNDLPCAVELLITCTPSTAMWNIPDWRF